MAVCEPDLPPDDIRLEARYVEAAARFFARRDAGSPLDEKALHRAVTLRDLLYHLEHVRRSLPLMRFLRGKQVDRPFFYPGGYIDFLPFLLSDITEAVYLDTAYFAPSAHPQAAFAAPAATLTLLCEELSEDPVQAVSRDETRLEVRVRVRQVQRRLTFLRGAWEDGALLSRAMPAGAGVYYGVEQPAAIDRATAVGGILRSLSPDFALISTAAATLDGILPIERHRGERATYTWWALPRSGQSSSYSAMQR